MITVYVIQSVHTLKLYVGITDSIERRLKEHNSGKSKYTSSFAPWKIIYTEDAIDYAAARKREKYLKSTAGKNYLKKILDGGTTGSLSA